MKAAQTPLKSAARLCATLLTAALASTAALAQETPATVPSSFEGTYELTYAFAQAGSPISNGTAVTLVIAPGNTLCVAGYTLTNPVLRNGNQHEAIWKETTAGVELALSSLVSGYNEINVGSTSGTWWGQFQGSKVSTSTSGCTGGGSTPDLTKINELFEKAQAQFAQYFPASANAVNQTQEGFIYRHYPSTGIYLAINDGDVYVMGGEFGNSPLKQGSLEAILSQLSGTTVDIPDLNIPEGDYKLTITGKTNTFGILTDIPVVVVDKIDPPKNLDEIRDAVKEAYKDVNITGTIDVTQVTQAGADYAFRIQFTASSSGVTFGYDVLYSYNKL